jgi:hypothetical protein
LDENLFYECTEFINDEEDDDGYEGDENTIYDDSVEEKDDIMQIHVDLKVNGPHFLTITTNLNISSTLKFQIIGHKKLLLVLLSFGCVYFS